MADTTSTPTAFAEAAGDLKSDLYNAISAAIHKFHARTGVSPSGIDVDMVAMTCYGDALRNIVPHIPSEIRRYGLS